MTPTVFTLKFVTKAGAADLRVVVFKTEYVVELKGSDSLANDAWHAVNDRYVENLVLTAVMRWLMTPRRQTSHWPPVDTSTIAVVMRPGVAVAGPFDIGQLTETDEVDPRNARRVAKFDLDYRSI